MTPAFHSHLSSCALALKSRLSQFDSLSRFHREIAISGRVHEGKLRIEFTLSREAYGFEKVTGGNLNSVLSEFIRRCGWTEQNQPLMLESPEAHPPLSPTPTTALAEVEQVMAAESNNG